MNFLRNRITILFLLALLITSGCRIIPWFGNYSDSPDVDRSGTVILSRNIEASQALSFSSPQLKLYIPAGALRYDSRVEITQYPLLLANLNLPKEYRPASQLFSINVLPELTTLSQAATLKFSIDNAVAGRSYMAAYRGNDGKWKFASPLQQSQTSDLVVETLNFSDWLVVERVTSFAGALSQGMQITASPSVAVASITGFFENDVEIRLNLQSDSPLSLNQASSILKMQLSTYSNFSIAVINPGSPDTSQEFNSDTDNNVELDLLNTSLATSLSEGNSTTYVFKMLLKGKTPAELPDFIAFKALYTTESGISYSAAQTLTFSEAPADDGEEPAAPQITDSLPANGTNDVASSTEIRIVFDQDMNIDATQAALRVSDRDGNAVSGSFSWENARALIFKPGNLLQPLTEYVIRFVDGATGQNGLALEVEGEIVFTTISNEPAELLSHSPQDGALDILFNSLIVLRFSQPMATGSLDFTISPEVPGGYTATWNETVTEVSISFNSGFASDIAYTVDVLGTSKDLYGQALKESYSFSFTSKAYVATRIIGISPASGSIDIDPSSSFELSFDKAMDQASLQAALAFSPALTGEVSYVWSADSMKLTISHTEKLQLSTEYQLSITQSEANQLIAGYQISYQTVDTLQVIETTPPDNTAGVTTAQTVEFKFNNPIDTNTLAVSFSPAPASGFTPSWSDNNTRLLLTPSPALDESRSYLVSVLADTADIYGNSLGQNHALNFSTGAFTQPVVASTLPENNAQSVAVSQQIKISFSKSMDKARTQAALSIQPSVSPLFSWQDSDKTMLIDFSSALASGTIYTFTLSTEATDLTGLKLAQQYMFSFKTVTPDSPEPTILTEYEPVSTSDTVDLFAPVILRFSAPIDQNTLDFEITPEITGGYTTTWNEAGTEASIVFSSGYASNQTYVFKVLPSTMDIYGQSIVEPDAFDFTSDTYSETRLVDITPASGSVGISPASSFELSFDKTMNTTSVEAAISFTPAFAASYEWLDSDTRLKITPASNLAFSTSYLLQIAQAAKAIDNTELVTGYLISYQTAAQLQIVETSPANNTAGTVLRTTVAIKFNNAVDKTSFAVSWLPAPASGYTQTWSESDTMVTLSPNADLLESQSYQITIVQATADTFGTTLSSDYVLSFTTGAVTPPIINSTLPLAGSYDIAVNQQIKVYFSKSMDKEKTQAATSITPAASPTFNWLDGDTTMVMSVGDALSYDTSYQITIATGATDKYGLSIEQSHLFDFKTAARPAVLTSKCYPLANATGIPPQAVIKVEFSKAMNKASAQTAFSLKQDSTVVDGSFSWSGNIMSFTPSASLAYGVLYQIDIAASAEDSLGNSLAAEVNWSFTTAADEGKVWTLEQADTENTTTFSQRSEHVMISFNNKLWVIGGFDGISYLNDVWSSSDGKNWTRETAAAAFAARSGHACIVYNGKIWMTGGYAYTDTDTLFDDVWSSSDGKNWVQVSSSADYYARSGHSMAVFADKLWVIGGETLDESNNLLLLDDCWSSGDGSSWQQRSTMVSFFPRKLHMSGVINNRLWVWGGYGEDSNAVEGALNDAWSTADGDFWQLETSNAAFPARCAAGYTTFNNRIWLAGGASDDPSQAEAAYYNDVWASSDGTSWVQILGNSEGSATQFSPRALHGAAVLSNKLFISGGELASYYLNNEVWSSQ